LLRKELRAKEAGVDDGSGDAEWCDLGLQRFHPALEAELRRRIGTHEVEAGCKARRRGDRDDVTRALLAHYRKHCAGHVHWAEETHRQLPLELLWRQLLEGAGVEARRIVDQQIDPTEPSTAAGTAASASLRLVTSSATVSRSLDCPHALDTASLFRPLRPPRRRSESRPDDIGAHAAASARE
jgi:hypothetical protein